MLSRRLALKAVRACATPRSVAFAPRRFYADVSEGAPTAQDNKPDYLSVARVRGVPIVSNYETGTEGYSHPDPEMTGGYVNPPGEKRQFRSPVQEYWNQQDRRNYGEPVNEDEDILGRFSPEVYTWTTPKMGLIQNGLFISAVFGLCGLVYMIYPDKPAVPRTFPYDGLRKSLGGENAPAAPSSD